MSEFVTKQIVTAQTLVARLRERAEEGQGMVEYALILAFIAILVIVALKFLQPAISNTLNSVTNNLSATSRCVHYGGHAGTLNQPPAGSPGRGLVSFSDPARLRIAVDHRYRRVTLPAGVGLDLGGIAKGLAVDAAVSCLRGLGVEAALVNARGDLAIHGDLPGGAAWPVRTEALPASGGPAACGGVEGRAAPQVVLLERGALATSGIARRHWQQGPQRRHHLLDPRTGLPAQSGLWAVTVVAARCVQAEVAATAAFGPGREEGARFLQERALHGQRSPVARHGQGRRGECGVRQTAGRAGVPWSSDRARLGRAGTHAGAQALADGAARRPFHEKRRLSRRAATPSAA